MTVAVGLQILILGCQPDSPSGTPNSDIKTKAQIEGNIWTINESNTIEDFSGEIPVYRTKFRVSVSEELVFKIDLRHLEGLNIGGMESFIVPIQNDSEVLEPWPIDGPLLINWEVPYFTKIFNSDLERSKKKCIAWSNLESSSFLIRIIFSDSTSVRRTGLSIIEILLE